MVNAAGGRLLHPDVQVLNDGNGTVDWRWTYTYDAGGNTLTDVHDSGADTLGRLPTPGPSPHPAPSVKSQT